jgi:non-specific serine/threonine protein kinase
MLDLKSLIDKYANKQLDFTVLLGKLSATSLLSQEEKEALAGQLEDALQTGRLSQHEFETLQASLERNTSSDLDAHTVLDPTGSTITAESDRTVVRKPATNAITIQSDAQADTSPEKTRVATWGESAHSPDATIVTSSGAAPTPSKEPAPGDLLKGRFVLEEILGRGGMGVVFKARDLRKEEAHDRNPYVAVKVLNDSFKAHPQSLIALQREARKAQQLAHPNIVTVYDFDRDGDTVYMTMEYLEGEPLDRIIRQHMSNPMEQQQAIAIIEGICLGLEHAHKHDTIHSDLKPGNVFVTKGGAVKVFDFGIARAMKRQEGGGEQTIFDAGELGGLTPAYASCEMLDGEEPDFRDDIYALACIAYELLGGRHPFNKIPADEARARKLSPPPIKALKKRQWKSLAKGLAFARADRSPNVAEFLESFINTRPLRKGYIIAAVVALIALAGLLIAPISQQWREHQTSKIIATLKSGSDDNISATLKKLPTLDKTVRDSVLSEGKDTIIAYFEKRAEAEVDTARAKYNFSGAETILNRAMQYYPDSAQVVSIITRLKNRKNQLLNDYTSRFNEQLHKGLLLPLPNKDDVLDSLSQVAAIDPQHPLLHDPRLPVAYAQQARTAMRAGDYNKAEKLLAAGLSLSPGETALVNLQDELQTAKLDRGSASSPRRAAELAVDTSLSPAARRELIAKLLKKPFATRDWSRIVLANLTQLEAGDPMEAAWAAEQRESLAKLHLAQAQKMRQVQRYAEARSLANYAKQFKPGLKEADQELKLIAAEQTRFEQAAAEQARQAGIDGLKQTLLTQAQANDVAKAKTSLGQLSKLLPATDPFLAVQGREAIANAYMRLSRDLADRKQIDQAIQLLHAGLDVAPNIESLKKSLADLTGKQSADADPCKTEFAGYGQRLRATCSDALGSGDKGPVMVVIPAGGAFSKPFAIGKYEISIGDYNIYCRLSKQCAPLASADASLALTGISIQDARRYVSWLAQQTGFNYHIPSDAEWVYAATADGKSGSKDYNCRVVIGDSVVKGNSILSVKSGPSNDWGLTNFIGNAQEWVMKGSTSLYARGGSFQDSLSNCNISLTRANDGTPNGFTGFRVARDMGRQHMSEVIGNADGK